MVWSTGSKNVPRAARDAHPRCQINLDTSHTATINMMKLTGPAARYPTIQFQPLSFDSSSSMDNDSIDFHLNNPPVVFQRQSTSTARGPSIKYPHPESLPCSSRMMSLSPGLIQSPNQSEGHPVAAFVRISLVERKANGKERNKRGARANPPHKGPEGPAPRRFLRQRQKPTHGTIQPFLWPGPIHHQTIWPKHQRGSHCCEQPCIRIRH